ncbi:MAG: hypothetical protein ACU0B8_14215, partial [Pseudooceanicola nanhaiensis]
ETLVKALMDDSEDQAHAGLSRLQLWTDADQAGRVWILFDVSDRAKAEGWLQRAAADTHGRRAGVTASDAHFLRTA